MGYGGRDGRGHLTSAVLGVEVLVDGVEGVLLLSAVLPGPQDVPDTLVQEGVLALQHSQRVSRTLTAAARGRPH